MKSKSAPGKTDPLQMEAEKLKEKLDKGEDVFILDVRSPEEHQAWKLSYDKYETPVLPMDKFGTSQKELAKQIPKDKEIVTLCAHGMRSQAAAQMLSKMGYNVKSIKGGMSAWNQVYDVAEVPLGNAINDVRVWQLRRVSKGCMAYVIASGKSAIVIDSTCDLDASVLKLAEENELKIVNVIDTHMHADHVSGLSTLAKKTGAKAFVGAKEGYEPAKEVGVKLTMVEDRQNLLVGNSVSITVIRTPGHTEGSLCFLLKSGKKNYLFTGDTLFVNGVGRPDLHSKAKKYATNLYNSYHEIILKYPDDTVLLPAHFDTSSITVKHGQLIMDTLGSIKKKNKLLSMPKDEFVKFMVSTVPPRPANYEKIVQINKKIMPCDQIDMGDLEEGPNSCAIKM